MMNGTPIESYMTDWHNSHSGIDGPAYDLESIHSEDPLIHSICDDLTTTGSTWSASTAGIGSHESTATSYFGSRVSMLSYESTQSGSTWTRSTTRSDSESTRTSSERSFDSGSFYSDIFYSGSMSEATKMLEKDLRPEERERNGEGLIIKGKGRNIASVWDGFVLRRKYQKIKGDIIKSERLVRDPTEVDSDSNSKKKIKMIDTDRTLHPYSNDKCIYVDIHEINSGETSVIPIEANSDARYIILTNNATKTSRHKSGIISKLLRKRLNHSQHHATKGAQKKSSTRNKTHSRHNYLTNKVEVGRDEESKDTEGVNDSEITFGSKKNNQLEIGSGNTALETIIENRDVKTPTNCIIFDEDTNLSLLNSDISVDATSFEEKSEKKATELEVNEAIEIQYRGGNDCNQMRLNLSEDDGGSVIILTESYDTSIFNMIDF